MHRQAGLRDNVCQDVQGLLPQIASAQGVEAASDLPVRPIRIQQNRGQEDTEVSGDADSDGEGDGPEA